MPLVNDFQSGGSFEIRVDDHDILLAVRVLIQDVRNGLTEDDSVGINLLGAADMEVRVGCRSNGIVDCCHSSEKRKHDVCICQAIKFIEALLLVVSSLLEVRNSIFDGNDIVTCRQLLRNSLDARYYA